MSIYDDCVNRVQSESARCGIKALGNDRNE
jgi:hypothetical protein